MVKKQYIILFLFIMISIVVGFLLFIKTPIFMQSTSSILKEANKLFREGNRKSDSKLLRQAIDKYSIVFERRKYNSNEKLVAGSLISKASVFMALDELNEAINSLKQSMQYNPIGEVQFEICLLEKQQGNLSILHECYLKTVDVFKRKKVSATNGNFLIARILSGDKLAIIDYKNVFKTLTGDRKSLFAMAAKESFDKDTYEEIVGKDYKIPRPFGDDEEDK